MSYTPAELMAAVAARELRDGEVVFVGIGLPEPRLQPRPRHARAATGPDLRVGRGRRGAGAAAGVDRRPVAGHRLAHGVRHGRRLPVAAAERPHRGRVPRRRADRPLRQHQHDRRRLATSIPTCGCPGSGGAAEIAIHARRTRRHQPPQPARLSRDRWTSSPAPATACSGRTRRELGMPGAGPVKVVTDKAHSRGRPDDAASWCSPALYPGVDAGRRAAPGSAGRSESRPALGVGRPAHRRRAAPPARRARSRSDSTSRADPLHDRPRRRPAEPTTPTLPRALGLRDMVLFNIVAVVSLRWFATAAAAGPSSITLWVLAALFFFVPQGLAVSDLAARYPEEGGIYAWTKRAFGEGHGFLCGWCYWVNNILYYPNLLMSTAVVGTYVIGAGQTGLGGQLAYVLPATLVALWLARAAQHRGRSHRALAAERRRAGHLPPRHPARRARRLCRVHPAVGHADGRRDAAARPRRAAPSSICGRRSPSPSPGSSCAR